MFARCIIILSTLKIVDGRITIDGHSYPVNKNIHMAAIGKAALGMIQGAEAALNGHIVESIASVPRGTIRKLNDVKIKTILFEGATNNLPDEDSCNNAQQIEEMARRLKSPDDIFLMLISGGGSALLSAPIAPMTVADKIQTVKALTSRGAGIKQLNAVRRALSRLKGGKLARIAHPAKTVAVIFSDIVGDPIEYIASGPTVVKQCAGDDPVSILKDFGVWDVVPDTVRSVLEHGEKPLETTEVDVRNVIVLNNSLALQGASDFLQKQGYRCHIVNSTIEQDADEYGQQLSRVIESLVSGKTSMEALQNAGIPITNTIEPNGSKIALLFGGECTVKMKGNGKGGRNQQTVLAAYSRLLDQQQQRQQHFADFEFALMSAGTDGQDGPTDAAGAIMTSEDLKYIGRNKNEIDAYLNNNDSYNFWKTFNAGNSHFITGITGTNVMDIQLLLLRQTGD